jgi:hypothetical protein
MVLYIIYFLFNLSSYYIAFTFSSALNASIGAAKIIFFIVYMALLLGIVIFVTLAPFFASLSFSPLASIKKSAVFVKHNYLKVLLYFLVFFVISWLISPLPQAISSAIQTIILTPYFVIVFLSLISEK